MRLAEGEGVSVPVAAKLSATPAWHETALGASGQRPSQRPAGTSTTSRSRVAAHSAHSQASMMRMVRLVPSGFSICWSTKLEGSHSASPLASLQGPTHLPTSTRTPWSSEGPAKKTKCSTRVQVVGSGSTGGHLSPWAQMQVLPSKTWCGGVGGAGGLGKGVREEATVRAQMWAQMRAWAGSDGRCDAQAYVHTALTAKGRKLRAVKVGLARRGRGLVGVVQAADAVVLGGSAGDERNHEQRKGSEAGHGVELVCGWCVGLVRG